MEMQSSMMKQLYSLPELMAWFRTDLGQKAEQTAALIGERKIRKVILTGCGDSYCAAMAVKHAFLTYTSLDVQVETVIELSRFYGQKHLTGAGDVLVIIISNSGTVSRCIELAERIRQLGGMVLGVTGKETSGLYRASSLVLKPEIPPFEYAPGIRSYTGCVYALFLLAVYLGCRQEVLGTQQAAAILQELERLEVLIEAGLDQWEQQAADAAKRFVSSTAYEWIGAGPAYASAWFSCAKLLETAGRTGGAYNTEDWFHMNYFIKDVERTATILFARSDARDHSRMTELIPVASEMGRPLLCITDRKMEGIPCLTVPSLKESLLSVFVDYIPAAMLTAYTGELLSETYFRDGKDRWTACVDFATIGKSRIVIIEEKGGKTCD